MDVATERRRSLADACAELASTMAQPDRADQVVPTVARQVTEVLGVGPAAVLLNGLDGPLATSPPEDELVAKVVAAERGLGAGPTVNAVVQGVATPADTLVDVAPRWPQWTEAARALGVGAWLAVPSNASGTSAVLVAASTRPRHWSRNEVAALQVLANLAAGWVTQQHELVEVRRTAAQLQGALDSRVVIEQAKGVLAGELGCSVDQAYGALRDHARRHSVTVRSVAHAVVDLGLRPPLGPPDGGGRIGRQRRQGAGQS
jgi:GAF domain-containing protein